MIISLLAALDENGGIGKAGRLPWRLSKDMRRFKSLTMGHTIIMGRKTWESIGRPLAGRRSFVITRSEAYQALGASVFSSLSIALRTAEQNGESEAFIIGGAEIFDQSLHLAGRMYLTRVHAVLHCDVFFPDYRVEDWDELDRQEFPADGGNEYPTTFIVFARKN